MFFFAVYAKLFAFIIHLENLPQEDIFLHQRCDQIKIKIVGLGGLGVTCSPRDPRFAGSNPAEVDGFCQDIKILSTSPPGGTLSWGSRV